MTDDDPPPEDPPAGESLPEEDLPAGWLKWVYGHLRRLANISTEIAKLTAENRKLRQNVQELADQVNRQAGQLDQINETIKARVEAEVRKCLEDQRKSN